MKNKTTQKLRFKKSVLAIVISAVSSGVCAVEYDLQGNSDADSNGFITSVTNPSAITITQNAIGLFAQDNGNDEDLTRGDNVSLTLETGVDLTGAIPVGSSVLAVYSRDVDDTNTGGWHDRFNFAGFGVLTLEGNNELTGIVGAHVDVNSSNQAVYAGEDPLSLINLNGGSSITFNDDVFASLLEVNAGGTVEFFGNVGSASNTTNLDLNGNDTTVVFGDGVTLSGNIVKDTGSTNSTLDFTGSATITLNTAVGATMEQVILRGGSNDLVQFNGTLATSVLDYQADATVVMGGNLTLNLNTAGASPNQVRFNDDDGLLQLANNASIVGASGSVAVSTGINNEGTLTMVSGTQSITGSVGADGLALRALNIGGVVTTDTDGDNNDSVRSITTIDGDIFASSVTLNDDGTNGSVLNVGSGHSLTGAVTVESDSLGTLTMVDGAQTVSGQVGTTSVRLGVLNAASSSTATTDFTADVFSDVVNVQSGVANFAKGLTGTTLNIGSGTANLNTASGASNINIDFGGAGTANLNRGITGNIDMLDSGVGTDHSTVNLSDDMAISGNITAASGSHGILNIIGDGSVTGTVGSGSISTGATISTAVSSLHQININTASAAQIVGDVTTATSASDFTSPLFTATLNNDTFATTVTVNDGAILELGNGADLTGNIVSASSAVATVNFTNASGAAAIYQDQTTDNELHLVGSSVITGNVGAADRPFDRIEAGADGSSSTFQGGVTYAEVLSYEGRGGRVDVDFGVVDSASAAEKVGFVGTVDFDPTATNGLGAETAVFGIGDDTNLVTQNAVGTIYDDLRTTFQNAANATLDFLGSSTVFGVLGAATNNNSTFQTFEDINAGVNGEVVTFNNDVYVSSTTFHVVGTGTVNFLGDLNGPLIYEAAGSVNVADGQMITDVVTTDSVDQGVLNFVGSATTQAQIGNSTRGLSAVNFHAATTDATVVPVSTGDEVIELGHDVYAAQVTIGGAAGNTTVDVTNNIVLGDGVTLTSDRVTFNTYDTDLVRLNDGTVSPGGADNVYDVTIDGGTFTTNGATLNFAVDTAALTVASGAGIASASGSSSINVGTGSVVMDGTETLNVNFISSFRDSETVQLINAASFTGASGATLADNSYIIDTTLNAASGSITVDRNANTYVTKSATQGHFSNDAAERLGALAASGLGYGQDMLTAINMLDLDQWGYGNNQANLATQVQRLAPLANHSIARSTFETTRRVADSIGADMHGNRLPESGDPSDTWWIRSIFADAGGEAIGQYDGFDTQVLGTTIGYDFRPEDNQLVGLAATFSSTSVDQEGLRAGDSATITGLHLSAFGAWDVDQNWTLGGALTLSDVSTESVRSTIVGRSAVADMDASQVTADLNVGYRFPIENTSYVVTPLLNLHSSHIDQDNYTETGSAGDLGLVMPGQNYSLNEVALGVRFEGASLWRGMVIKPDVTVMAFDANADYDSDIVTQFAGDTSSAASFTTISLDNIDQSGARIELGLDLLMSEDSSMDLRVKHDATSDFDSTSVDITARWKF